MLLVGKGSPERGGISTFLEGVLTRLAGTVGLEVEFLNLADGEARSGGAVSFTNARATVRDVARVGRSAGQFDVVHVHSACAPGSTMVRAGVLCAAARGRGARTVLHVHGGLVADWLRGPRRCHLARWSLGHVDRIVAVAAAPARALGEALGREISMIPNGVDSERFSPASGRPKADDVPTLLMVGGLTPRKGVLDLLAASERLRRRGVIHALVLAGGTPDDGEETEREVRRAIESAGDHVTVVPPVPNREMPEVYRGADVFCLPSWWEAQPLSLLEAMSCGLPAVATDVGDVRTQTDGGRTARLVPVSDIDALTEELQALITDEELRSKLGSAARRHAISHHDIGSVVDAITREYGEAVAARSRRRAHKPVDR